ncbi:MAG: filament integrity protein FraC [Coleofasciculaceae cyanobacterium]
MSESVLPLPTILWQILLLLVAIALEARVFHRRLLISRRASVEFAVTANLFVATIGWITFFIFAQLAPQTVKAQIMSYIFFGRLMDILPENFTLMVAAAGFLIFILAFLIKLKGIELLEAFLQSSQGDHEQRPTLASRLNQAIVHTNVNQAMTIFLANGYSFCAIFLVLFLRFIFIQGLIAN